jgi:hypothetical protein
MENFIYIYIYILKRTLRYSFSQNGWENVESLQQGFRQMRKGKAPQVTSHLHKLGINRKDKIKAVDLYPVLQADPEEKAFGMSQLTL